MRHHELERIQGYCLSCDKHGKFWSCPPFEQQPLTRFPTWSHAVVICQKTDLAPGTKPEVLIDTFQTLRVEFGKLIRELEARAAGVTALVAGHCAGCEDCSRPLGEPCRAPELMRHSLESVGFDVTGIAEKLAGQKLHWRKGGIPDYLVTVGALLCPERSVAAALAEEVSGAGA